MDCYQHPKRGLMACAALCFFAIQTSCGSNAPAPSDAATATDSPDATSDAVADIPCEPACRSGFVCSHGSCVSACNPVCMAGEACVLRGSSFTCTPTAPDAAVTDAEPSLRCAATVVPCQDQSIQSLGLFDVPNPALVSLVSMDNGVFVNEIDAVGGGMTPTRAFVYARFTPTGLEKVSISDEDALTSLDWDLAFRRFIIRVNSGVSGPSCVDVARTAARTNFDSLTAVPSGLTYHTEEYFTPSPGCMLVPDGSGLGSPSTALSSFWMYSGCVHMTGNVYVVRLRDGRNVKLQVLSYYSPAAQLQCNTMDTLPASSGAARIRVRWSIITG